MSITGPQARAARALVEWPRDAVARRSGVDEDVIAAFEIGKVDPGDAEKARLRAALEDGGAVFIDEGGGEGRGVRLKYAKKDARAVNRMESEGGPVGDDDV